MKRFLPIFLCALIVAFTIRALFNWAEGVEPILSTNELTYPAIMALLVSVVVVFLQAKNRP